MGQDEYTVLVPQLAKKLGLGAMDLVRTCNLAVGTAYKALEGNVDLNTCGKIYFGLKKSGVKINGRIIRFSDVVDLGE